MMIFHQLHAIINNNMYTKNKKTNTKKNISIITLALIVILAGFTIYHYKKNNPTTLSHDTTPTNNPVKNNIEPKSKTENKSNNHQGAPSKDKRINTDPQASTSVNKTNGKTIVTVVTSASVSEDIVYIRGGINNVVSDGECYAQLKSPSGSFIEKRTTLLPGVSTADCKTIRIPVSELLSGTWTYTLKYSSSTTEGVSNENSFQIK